MTDETTCESTHAEEGILPLKITDNAHHEYERHQRECCNSATEPENLPICLCKVPINQTDKLNKGNTHDEDDGQVLEYRIHRNR